MRPILLAVAGCVAGALAASAQTASPEACFQVIEGQADVPPAAPLLVDRCSGATFLLARTRRDGKTAFEWVPITKAAPGTVAESVASPAPPSPPSPAPRSKGAGRDGCFIYNGRSYCQ